MTHLGHQTARTAERRPSATGQAARTACPAPGRPVPADYRVGVSGSDPFSPRRRRSDLVNALPGLGLLLGAVCGAALGALTGSGSVVGGAGVGIALGLVLGVLARTWLRRG